VRRLRLELIERRDESFQKSDGATGSSGGSAIGQDLAQLAAEDEAARKRRQPLLSDWATDCLVDIYKQHRKSLGAVAENVTAIYEKVLDGSIALENVCLACGTVRVEQQLPLLMEHPVLRGSLCVDCLENYLTVCFSVGDDGWFMYCSVCGRPGNQAMCGSAECGRCFCQGCLTLLIGQDAWQRIISDNGWLCHLCQLLSERLIQPRSDWRQRLQTEPHSLHPPPPPELQRSAGCSQPLRVLSLFDGVASALLCLQSAGLSVEICFASEIDPDAIRVAACNHGNRVRQLGSVTELTEDRLRSLLPIDLLIGGSPCSQLSAANPNRQGLASESGLLFFEFHRILELLRRIGSPSADERQRRPLFWLFENVASMRQEDKTRISRFLGREPIRLDAVIFSAQRRARLFWGNLPGMLRSSGVASTLAADVVHCARPAAAAGPEPRETDGRAARHATVGCVTTKRCSGRGPDGSLPVADADGLPDALWVTELERLFGFPAHYTDCGLTDLARRKLIGRSWCLPLVAHLLRPLRHFFAVLPGPDAGDGDAVKDLGKFGSLPPAAPLAPAAADDEVVCCCCCSIPRAVFGRLFFRFFRLRPVMVVLAGPAADEGCCGSLLGWVRLPWASRNGAPHDGPAAAAAVCGRTRRTAAGGGGFASAAIFRRASGKSGDLPRGVEFLVVDLVFAVVLLVAFISRHDLVLTANLRLLVAAAAPVSALPAALPAPSIGTESFSSPSADFLRNMNRLFGSGFKSSALVEAAAAAAGGEPDEATGWTENALPPPLGDRVESLPLLDSR
uniref:DNA (cytosine-5-)-methyltransferase n=1 Tax=Macrostomum lignano TaxID=282301 RepID=A0A1I8IPI0_9PLAT